MYADWSLVLSVANTLAVPLTVFTVAVVLRPLLKRLLEQTTSLKISGFELSPSEIENLPASAPEKILAQSRQKLEEGLKEESKEKLENIRLALEAEQVNQLIQYHANSLAQSQLSFRFSIAAATAGFAIIAIGVGQLYFVKDSSQGPILTLVAGTIIDAVAALFFTQSNQARKSMTEFFDKLRLDRQFNESLRLCESIRDPLMQSQIKSKLCLYFAGIREPQSLLETAKTELTSA